MLNIKLIVGLLFALSFATFSAAGTPTSAQCQAGFKLKGEINTAWKKVTLNAWNEKILPPVWIDKGGHFLKQIKKRGDDAAVQTPSDLESFVRGAALSKNRKEWAMAKVAGNKKILVIFDINPKSKKCELVTFKIESR